MTDQHGDAEDTVLRPRRPVEHRPAPSVDVDDTVLVGRPPEARPVRHHHDGTEAVDTADTVVGVARRGAAQNEVDDDTVVGAGARRPWAAAPTVPAPPAPAADRFAARVHSLRVAGAVHRLDRPLVVGRRPTRPRVPRGPEAQLVTVASPTGQVSSAHVDVRQEGDVVVVTDLRSTNGTRVSAPGRPPVVLRQGESLVVLAGSLVDLGDGVVVEVLPPQRLTLEEGSRP